MTDFLNIFNLMMITTALMFLIFNEFEKYKIRKRNK